MGVRPLANQQLSEYLKSLVHDLRNALSAMQSTAQLILREEFVAAKAQREQALATILRQAGHLSTLFNEIIPRAASLCPCLEESRSSEGNADRPGCPFVPTECPTEPRSARWLDLLYSEHHIAGTECLPSTARAPVVVACSDPTGGGGTQ